LRSAAAQVLLRRRAARRQLEGFTTYTFPKYVCEPAHALISAHLDRVVSGELKRLMIFAPPQHGKSELVSVRLPAYWLGRRPDDPVILTSYAASLAESKSRQARQIVEGPEFRRLFPGQRTRRDSRAVDHWELAGHRGSMLAAGVGGPITGHGAMLGIIDDPVENWAEAHSQTIRESIWEWYRSTFRTRIWEGGAIVLIMTRWHEDDLAGRLLQAQANEWEILRLPALAESQDERDEYDRSIGRPIGQPDPLRRKRGEPLCPKRYSKEALEQLRRDVGAMAWAGQYQGRPRAPEGNRIKRDWLPVVDPPPNYAPCLRVRYWDKAATPDGGCHTAGVLMAKTVAGLYYVEEVVRGQWSAGERDAIMLKTAKRDRVLRGATPEIWVEEEPGSGGKESAQNSVRLLAGFSIHAERVRDPKHVRIEPFASQAEGGNVRLVRAPWNGPYIDELCSFPNGLYTDQADATSGAFNKLARQNAKGVPAAHGGTPYKHLSQSGPMLWG
jgi:predicted phage terminase large subunit-like protein